MKTVSVVIPTYNEIENIQDGYVRVKGILDSLSGWDYEILYIDNYSTDGTRNALKKLAKEDSKVKVILNAVNVGWSRSSFFGLLNSSGDAVVLLSADMQEPPELIPTFIAEYEKGHKIVVGIKNKSKENPIKYAVRNLFYAILKKTAEINHIEQFMGFGLYDKKFIEVLRQLDDPLPYLRGIVAELGGERAEIYYTQDVRKKGKTHFNFWGMYDLAMLGITSYTKNIMRLATIGGLFLGVVSLVISLVTFFLKVFGVVDYPLGTAAIIVALFFFGAVLMFFVGLLGEYVLCINTRVMKRPLVVVEERLNFDNSAQ